MMRAGHARYLTADEAASYAAEVRAAGGCVVFTNGVFDVLHPGHLRYLTAARALGDVLIVGLNADASVRRNKGPERPVHPQEERRELLAALRPVDGVVIFDDDTPEALVARVQPDVLVKGADWSHDAIVGRDVVESRGGRVVRMPLTEGFSTTTLLNRIRQLTHMAG